MQWKKGDNLGFSTADAEKLYLPVDSAEDAPTVEMQENDKDSLLNTVRSILELRHNEEDLKADALLVPVCTEPDKPFVYKRGELLCAVNPAGESTEVDLGCAISGEVIFKIGDASFADGKLCMAAQSFAVIRTK